MTAALSTQQAERLEAIEARIQKGVKSFLDVGNALMEVKQEQLWRGEYESFDDYCQRRWNFSQWYAYRLTSAVEVANRLDNCPKKPKQEAQLRPLAKLPKDQQAAAWQEAVDEAEGDEPTAKEVAAVVERRKPKKAKTATLFICQECNTQYTDGRTECDCEPDTVQAFADEPAPARQPRYYTTDAAIDDAFHSLAMMLAERYQANDDGEGFTRAADALDAATNAWLAWKGDA